MSASNRPVSSREYKLMLNVERFKNRDEGAQLFLELLDFLVRKEGGKITEKQNKVERRQTSYLDTAELALHQQGYSLRLREEAAAADGCQTNLKYRAADRYLSAAQDLSGPSDSKTKFEEDILPPFVSKFSHSTSIKTSAPPDLSSVGKVVALFPGLAGLKLDQATAVQTVNDFKAAEVVVKLCKLQFGAALVVKASLSFWYLDRDEHGWPLVAEFSFDYDLSDGGGAADKLEMYPAETVAGANRLFGALQNQAGWLSANTTTKTAFALEVL